MTENLEFSITESTLEKLLALKQRMGLDENGWDELLNQLLASYSNPPHKNQLEKIFEKMHYKNYEEWVINFAMNLNYIWKESSAKELEPSKKDNDIAKSAIVIGAGPSVKKHKHLELLAHSDYRGSIICTDRMLIPTLKAGITPDKFSNFYVVTIDPIWLLEKFYDDEIVDRYGNKIKGIFSTIIHPSVVGRARRAGMRIHWLHSLFDYNEGKKSFNQISALMVRAQNHKSGLPAIQTGGNVGTTSWFVAWQILKCSVVGLIGINHSWDEGDHWESIAEHCKISLESIKNNPESQKFFPKVYNPEFNCNCVLDPIFLYYSEALKEFISRSPSWLKTINATEGGCIFGNRITCTTFAEFLKNYKN